jgi:hypothetical protein
MGKLTARLLLPHEREKYQEHMQRFHYLGALTSSLGKALQYVIEDERGQWLALMDWGYGALKNGARDRWIGWDEKTKNKRLRYVVNNTRFLILPWANGVKFLASQALALVTRRLSTDWSRYHGHHVLVAETFVDTSRFRGTCYKAANWICVGETKGFGRSHRHYFEHGEKKAVFVYPLCGAATHILSSYGFPHPWLTSEKLERPMFDLNTLHPRKLTGLLEMFQKFPDRRTPAGRIYSLPSLLALTVCALLSGCSSFQSIYEFGQALSCDARRRLGFRPVRMPTEPVIRYVLNALDAKLFDQLAREWILHNIPSLKGHGLAVDGKTMRAARSPNGTAPHILSVVLHREGLVLGQQSVPEKTNEIPEIKTLLNPIHIRGAVVTADAMHTQVETACYLVEDKGADFVMTVKGNQLELLKQLERLQPEAFSPAVDHD